MLSTTERAARRCSAALTSAPPAPSNASSFAAIRADGHRRQMHGGAACQPVRWRHDSPQDISSLIPRERPAGFP